MKPMKTTYPIATTKGRNLDTMRKPTGRGKGLLLLVSLFLFTATLLPLPAEQLTPGVPEENLSCFFPRIESDLPVGKRALSLLENRGYHKDPRAPGSIHIRLYRHAGKHFRHEVRVTQRDDSNAVREGRGRGSSFEGALMNALQNLPACP